MLKGPGSATYECLQGPDYTNSTQMVVEDSDLMKRKNVEPADLARVDSPMSDFVPEKEDEGMTIRVTKSGKIGSRKLQKTNKTK